MTTLPGHSLHLAVRGLGSLRSRRCLPWEHRDSLGRNLNGAGRTQMGGGGRGPLPTQLRAAPYLRAACALGDYPVRAVANHAAVHPRRIDTVLAIVIDPLETPALLTDGTVRKVSVVDPSCLVPCSSVG
jgi:hypothetical protein